jgi:hypothetical protein
MKFVHKLVSGDVTPWTRWVRRWYGEYGISHAPSVHDTPSWRTFKHVFATYRQLTSVVVGTGCTVSFWLDNWHRAGPLFACLPALFSHCTSPNISLADVLRPSGLSLPLRPRLTDAAESELVALSAALHEFPLSDVADDRRLPGGTIFASAEAYRLLHISGVSPPLGDVNWSNFAPKKVQIFFWIARYGNTRTRAFLHRHGCLSTAACPFCPAPEDLAHLMFVCPRLAPFWSALGVQATRPVDLEGVCDAIAAPTMHLPVPVRHSLTLLVLWVVWKSRNRKVFDNVPSSPRQLSSMIHTHYNLRVHRLPSKTPRHGADAWCSRVCDALNSLA